MTAFMPTCNWVRAVAAQTLSTGGFSTTDGTVGSGAGVSVVRGVGAGSCVGSLVSVGDGVAWGVFVAMGVDVAGTEVEVAVDDEITATTVGVA